MNEDYLVLAENGKTTPAFSLQFAPYNNSQNSTQCSIPYSDPIYHFVYTVAIGKKQLKNETYFFFAGELTNNQSGIFIGMVVLNQTNIAANLSTSNSNMPSTCNNSFTYFLQYLYNYSHQEYFILGVEPRGRRVYGFSTEFILMFDAQNPSALTVWNGSEIWPDKTFIPHAVDISDNFGVISGFIFNGKNASVKHSPMIYLMTFKATSHRPVFVNQYKPLATPGTWQDLLVNADANIYSAKYDMSVSINEHGNVLVGMQFINRVFLFAVNTAQPTRLTFISRHTNGRTLGNGKCIAWLQDGIAALIVNVYTLSYQWSSSQMHVYGIENSSYNSNSTPLSVFPNYHEKLPSALDPVFISLASSPSAVALLDARGHILIYLPTPPGSYLVIEDTGSMPLVSSSRTCMPGTYKNQSGIHDCSLCPPGTRNPGDSPTACIPCSPQSFCPLASVDEVSNLSLQTIIQAIPYPKSPESVIFDEILIQNMFSIGSGRCVLISPFFWTLIVAGIAVLMIVVMGILKHSTKNPRGRKVRAMLKCVFRHTDLIGEGELWVGGLASFSVIVLITFACVFSQNYVKQYPIETSSESRFACDTTMRNAKFQTTVQSLAIPLTTADQKMFDLLNDQEFFLKVDLVNTQINCDAVSIDALFGTTWSTIRWTSCDNINSTLYLVVLLPYQHISVQVNVADPKTIGAIRIGLFGEAKKSGIYSLKELNFYQSFFKIGQILARNLPITMSLTKVVNETLAMDGGESTFGGIHIPTFTVDYNSLFYNVDQFVRSTLISTTLSLVLSETPYYVKNLQQPIAKPSEIIFQNLLFITVCLELFGLIFLSYKLVFKPLYMTALKKKYRKNWKSSEKKKSINGDLAQSAKPARDEVRIDMGRSLSFWMFLFTQIPSLGKVVASLSVYNGRINLFLFFARSFDFISSNIEFFRRKSPDSDNDSEVFYSMNVRHDKRRTRTRLTYKNIQVGISK